MHVGALETAERWVDGQHMGVADDKFAAVQKLTASPS
jgi:hypothetical protein